MDELLSREEFQRAVFARDRGLCVICRQPAADAHHIVERRLWPDGGYYLGNGASLCAGCHWRAETTALSCADIRRAAGIERVLLPWHLESGTSYDKWGNACLPDGTRAIGELFFDESVQRVLAQGGMLDLFRARRVRAPRTLHLPWSPGRTADDGVLEDLSAFAGRQVVVTTKMDGESATLYRDYLHARAIDGAHHPSQSWVRRLHAEIAGDIPAGWRLVGENLFARHTIHYHHLPAYFMLHSVWDAANLSLPWAKTCEWAELLGLATVPVVYVGLWDEALIRGLYRPGVPSGDECEGYAVRVAGGFSYAQFRTRVAKYVRAGHVQTSSHWRYERLVRNELQG